MALTIHAATGFSTTFFADFCPMQSMTRFGLQRFGTMLLQLDNTGPAAAVGVVVTISPSPGEMTLYGPVSHVSILPGSSIPIGVRFARTNPSTVAASSTVTVQWRDAGAPAGAPPNLTTISLVCNMRGYTCAFVPSVLEMVASAQTPKSVTSRLFCESAITAFQVAALPPFSASVSPAGSFLAG